MIVNTTVNFYNADRTAVISGLCPIEVPKTTAAEAPVVYRIWKNADGVWTHDTDISVYKGKWYKPVMDKKDDGSKCHRAVSNWECGVSDTHIYHTEMSAKHEARQRMRNYIVIDGFVWRVAIEPYYAVLNSGCLIVACHYHPSAICVHKKFSATEEEKAKRSSFAKCRALGHCNKMAEWKEKNIQFQRIEIVDPIPAKTS